MRQEVELKKLSLIFVWGLVLIVVALRIYFYTPLYIPKNSEVELEVVVKNLQVGEKSQRIEFADVAVFAPLYPQIELGDRLNIVGFVNEDGRIFEPKIEKIGHDESLSSQLWKFRKLISSRVSSILPPRESTLVVGTVLGVDTIGADFRDELIKTGTIHVVVVSGQNLAIIAGIFISLSRYLGKKIAVLLAFVACVLYAIMTGFEVPVVRALFMVAASSIALYFGRTSSALISILVAALVIVSIWPDSLYSISFQLTFAATVGIVVIGSRLTKLMRIPILGEVTAVCIGAFATTAPVVVYHFGQISLLSPIVNILVSEAVFPIMVLGFLTSVLTLVYMPAAQVFAYIVYVPARYFVEVVSYFAQFNAGTVDNLNVLPLLFLFLFLLCLLFIWRREVK